MAEHVTTTAPRTGVWPDGEPRSVRDAYDTLIAAARDQAPSVPLPREPAKGREATRGGRRGR